MNPEPPPMTNHPIEPHPLVRAAALKLLLPIAKIERDVRVHDLTEGELMTLVLSVLGTIRDLTPDVAEAGAVEVGDLCRSNVPWTLISERTARAHTAMINAIIGESA